MRSTTSRHDQCFDVAVVPTRHDANRGEIRSVMQLIDLPIDAELIHGNRWDSHVIAGTECIISVAGIDGDSSKGFDANPCCSCAGRFGDFGCGRTPVAVRWHCLFLLLAPQDRGELIGVRAAVAWRRSSIEYRLKSDI